MPSSLPSDHPSIINQAKIEIPADLTFSASVRNLAQDVLIRCGFQEKWLNRLKLVVDEMFMNAVKYGSDKNSLVRLNFYILKNGVKISISDEGKGSEKCSPEKLKKLIQKQKENSDIVKTSGRGLSMFASEWSDSYDIFKNNQGGLTVTFTKLLNTSDS